MENELGFLLRSLRGKMSLREAAHATGLSHTYISDVEHGYNRSTRAPVIPSPDTLRKFALAYHYSFDELMRLAGHIQAVAPVDELISRIQNGESLEELRKDFELTLDGDVITEEEWGWVIAMIRAHRASAL